ncbi:2-octaprenyl-3-methyl-6-methoxy-1,4-benzoquinol hydroxylase [Vibrio sp. SS-MA-C1-2]|uniref:2-octaprenyl-3-methyl-6-methoxy-1,4-benzoquinol hydroxylase n=1 Tax=Vibrio sp. SS-MA-C1-2 TaxID=2908646 RepID=UPI001F02A31B|nr:2-octaprenyl-3-methyl-6-methoxy-1,4-benzoquinol hydroxylase [Vibrio sp. SS-MA-C1-2]UJF18809.1 2-octaprenyl-3-methyl-6-methoxy-1,4-benzoquinol hydroxylase [Vibrio sp. SS-MA-C1-2]
MKSFDVVIVGGGMVGAATAVGLAQQGKSVAIIEAHTPKPFEREQDMDLRVSAISHASVELLESLGAWDAIKAMRICPYKELATWENPECKVSFHSDEINIEQLGFIVENRLIQLGLWQQFESLLNLKCFSSTTMSKIVRSDDGIDIHLSSGETLHTQLLVGADGANSQVRQWAKIGLTSWDYRQHCMLINISTEKPQQDITWQWFTPSGPRSFLPLSGQKGSLVWYDSPKRIKQLQNLNPEQLKDQIIHAFPDLIGEFTVDASGSFPLTRRHAQSYWQPNIVLLGDAAHTINPLAGQGVNLGFKDVKALLESIEQHKENWASEKTLRQYQSKRRNDNLLMQSGMDFFYAGFSNNITPLKIIRNLGFAAAQRAGFIKHELIKYAVGLK